MAVIETADLSRIEKDAFRRFYEDGLFDVFLGLMLALMPLTSSLERWLGDNEAAILAVLLAVYGAIVVGFTVGRKRLLSRRLGSFKPAPSRRRKLTVVRLVLLLSVVLGAVAFGVSAWVFGGGGGEGGRSFVNLVPMIWFLNATGVFAAMAYFMDVPRFYAYGPLFGVTVMLEIYSRTLFDYELSPLLAFGVPAAAIIGIGIYKLVHFLRDFPVIENGMALDGPR